MPALEGVVLATGDAVDVRWEGDRVISVSPAVRGGSRKLLLPAFVDTHVHLDKALIRDDLRDHDGTLAGAIDAIHERKRRYTAEDVAARAETVIETSVLHGTTRLRSHVDVDTIGGLVPLEGVLEAARRCAEIAEVEVIAFPQEGLLRDPGALELMARALEAGAGVVGGMPHWELDDASRREHVRLCFELAERFDRDLDMHVDETDDGSVRTLEMVADEALRRGWRGRVTAGHVCSLAAADEDYAARVIEKCARAEMTIVANPVTNLVIQGRDDRGLVRRGTTRIAELRSAGVNLAFGQDCVKDGFYPFGRGDMLEVALISAHAAHLSTRADLDYALEAVTAAPARAWGLGDYGIRSGARADFALYAAPSWPEALRLQRPPERVWFKGAEVATTVLEQSLRGRPLHDAFDAPCYGGRMVNELSRLVFASLSRLRGRRIFHPSGTAYRATLRLDLEAAAAEGWTPGTRTQRAAVARFSRGAGLPEPLPDVLGVALRIENAYGTGRPQDLLMVSTLPGPGLRHLLVPSLSFAASPFSTVLLYRTRRGLRLFGLKPAGELADVVRRRGADAQAGMSYDLFLTSPAGMPRRIGVLEVGRKLDPAASERIRFNPWNAGGGLRPWGILNRLRRDSYEASQRARAQAA